MNDQTERDDIRTQLRIPAELHQKLTDAAARSKRSMNGEIVHRLAMTLDTSLEHLLIQNRLSELSKVETQRAALEIARETAWLLLDNAKDLTDEERWRRQEQVKEADARIPVLAAMADMLRSEVYRLQSGAFLQEFGGKGS